MNDKLTDLGLTALDELFMTDDGRKENKLPRIREIPLNEIDDIHLILSKHMVLISQCELV